MTVADRIAQAPTLQAMLSSGEWVPGPEFQVNVSEAHVRVVGHTLIALENLIVAAVLAEMGREEDPDARSFVAENIGLLVTEASIGSYGSKIKSYVRKTLLPALHEKTVEQIVELAFLGLLAAGTVSDGPANHRLRRSVAVPQVL